MSTDKIASGTGDEDTYIKMLSSIKGSTTSMAEGIGRIYPSIRSLYEGYEQAGGDRECCEMLIGALVSPSSTTVCERRGQTGVNLLGNRKNKTLMEPARTE